MLSYFDKTSDVSSRFLIFISLEIEEKPVYSKSRSVCGLARQEMRMMAEQDFISY